MFKEFNKYEPVSLKVRVKQVDKACYMAYFVQKTNKLLVLRHKKYGFALSCDAFFVYSQGITR